MPGRRSLWRPDDRAGPARSGRGPALAPRGGAPRPARAQPELPRRRRGPRADPGRGGADPGSSGARDRSRARDPHRRPARCRRRVTAVELDRGLASRLRDHFADSIARDLADPAGPGDAPAHRRRRARPAADPALSGAVRRRRQPALPHHQPDPPSAARGAAASRSAGADGPARGRRADRGAARKDELPVGLRPVPRGRSGIALRVPPTAFEPAPEVDSAVIVVEPYPPDDRLDPAGRGRALAARPGRRSGSAGRCSTTSLPGSWRCRPSESPRSSPPPASIRTGGPRRSRWGSGCACSRSLGPIGPDRRGRQAVDR